MKTAVQPAANPLLFARKTWLAGRPGNWGVQYVESFWRLPRANSECLHEKKRGEEQDWFHRADYWPKGAKCQTGRGHLNVDSTVTLRPVRCDSWQAFITSRTCNACSGLIKLSLPVRRHSATYLAPPPNYIFRDLCRRFPIRLHLPPRDRPARTPIPTLHVHCAFRSHHIDRVELATLPSQAFAIKINEARLHMRKHRCHGS